ncbi:MAG TPA: glycosyltransferase family 4 protein [Tepidisphaeraceae bacterium]|nr:glycosyltransferase family 4 protein [Tepidisphaeraceae bacterium]
MAKVLLASHSPTLSTGYGRVTRDLAQCLMDAGHAVRAIGAGYAGERNPHGFPIVPSAVNDFGGAVQQVRAEWSPQRLITIGDPWMFDELPTLRRSMNLPWIACFPIDSEPLPDSWKAWINAVDRAIVFSEYAAGIVRAQAGRTAVVMPHGVDHTVFRPLDKAQCKARVGVAGKFVVGTVAANQRRKSLPALIAAFARFARDKPDALLYLHTPIVGEQDLQLILDHHGVTDHTRATLNYDPLVGLCDDDLATVYNSFYVFVLPTMAEGFGLPLLESQACGVPTLATDCSSCTELLPHPLQRVRVSGTEVHARGVARSLIDEPDLTDRLDHLYHDPALRAEIADASLRFAARFGWNQVARPLLDAIP